MGVQLDIVMVAYRSEEDLPDLLSGIKEMTRLPYQLHFYDNIGNTKTLTRAWNDLAAQGTGEYVAFLNTDIRVSPDWDARLVEGLKHHADAGVVIPKPVGHDWPRLVDPTKAAYTNPASAPAPTLDVMRKLAQMREFSKADYNFGGSCNAAFYAVLMRRETWLELKGFDERFRFYGQDHDFQRRMLARLGKYTMYIARAPAWHRCGGSVKKAVQHGDVDFNAEMAHHGNLTRDVKSGRVPEWDLLSDAQRAAVRKDPLYLKIPTFKRRI